MPENMRGTLTSSGSNSVHKSTFIIIPYRSCSMTISEYPGSSQRENYACVVDVAVDLQRAFFHDVTDFFLHSTIANFLSLYTHRRVLFEHQNLATMTRSHCQHYFCCGAQVHAESPRRSILSIEAIAEVD